MFAIDGTTVRLPQSHDIGSKFSLISGSRLPHGRVSFMYDISTGYIIDGRFEDIKVSERDMTLEHLEAVKSRFDEKDLVIADRGYASKELLKYLTANHISFLFRLQRSFSSEVDASNKTDFIWNMKDKNISIPIRVLKFTLPSGEIETLITSVKDASLSVDDFAHLYSLRWGIETRYNFFKNAVNIEEFSVKKEWGLKQDFYARLFLMNIEAAIKVESDAKIAAEDKGKTLKYHRKTNEHILVGILKREFASLFFEPDASKRSDIIQRITIEASRSKCDIKPGRSFPRTFRSHKRITAPPKRVV
jgi:transposase